MDVETMTDEALGATERQIRTEVFRRREARDANKNAVLVGKFFVYQNCCSCPGGPEDYWPKYFAVTRLDGGTPFAWTWERDRDGRIRVEPSYPYPFMLHEGCIEISREAFFSEYKKLLASLDPGVMSADGPAGGRR